MTHENWVFVKRQVKAMMIDGVQGCPTETILLTMRDRKAERRRARQLRNRQYGTMVNEKRAVLRISRQLMAPMRQELKSYKIKFTNT